ncbi:MAG: hypothetical protein KF775_05895 [Cyclobacteriaceae bacterium]|nr:hypothetical protein [Cyclobacteriaceae bacterium]
MKYSKVNLSAVKNEGWIRNTDMRRKFEDLLRNERFLKKLEIGVGILSLLFILILLRIFLY